MLNVDGKEIIRAAKTALDLFVDRLLERTSHALQQATALPTAPTQEDPLNSRKPGLVGSADPQRKDTGENEPQPWPCDKCGRPAVIEAVEPSLNGERVLTFWHCPPCQSYAVTPSTVKEPPKGWATKTRQEW